MREGKHMGTNEIEAVVECVWWTPPHLCDRPRLSFLSGAGSGTFTRELMVCGQAEREQERVHLSLLFPRCLQLKTIFTSEKQL